MEFARERFEAGFRAEAACLLRRLEQGLSALRRAGKSSPLLGEMARDAHTLRGSATMMGHGAMADTARLMEESLDRARDGGIALESAHHDLLEECILSLRLLLDGGAEARARSGDLGDRAGRLFGTGAS
jgi:chemotaxis protein histidine kinase CheA